MTYDEAVAKAHECIEGFLEALAQKGQPIPEEPTAPSPITISVRVNEHALSIINH